MHLTGLTETIVKHTCSVHTILFSGIGHKAMAQILTSLDSAGHPDVTGETKPD